MRRRTVAAAAVVVLAGIAGYGALDVADVTPGILTRAPLPTPTPTATPTPTVAQPGLAPAAEPLTVAAAGGREPTTAALRAKVARLLTDPRLGSVGAVVRDATTGATLLDVDGASPRIPASSVKLLAAAAIDATFPQGAVLTTRTVRGAAPDEVVLVAGGDTLLAPGAGSATAVVGHAGLGDLAAATAKALRTAGVTSVTVTLDASYAAGPIVAPTWSTSYQPTGITGAVASIGLSTERALPDAPGPADPASSALGAFVTALRATGLTVARGQVSAARVTASAPLASVTSAPVADQLALALRESDNALTESLARQAEARATKRTTPATFAGTAAWIRTTLTSLGVDVAGVSTVDASGLSREDRVPTRVVADALGLGAGSDRLPSLRTTLSELSIAGLDGSLADRFGDPATRAAAGVVRAKTGTLTGVSALAGTLTTADGRLLTFALLANEVPTSTGTAGAREALDEFVTALTSCGCS